MRTVATIGRAMLTIIDLVMFVCWGIGACALDSGTLMVYMMVIVPMIWLVIRAKMNGDLGWREDDQYID